MESWKANSLSKASRAVLIQSNLESLPTHTMQCFELPKKNTRKKSTIDKGLLMITWERIYQPKKLEGLGLRKTEAVSLAMQISFESTT